VLTSSHHLKNRTRENIAKWHATVYNKHIGSMAALPPQTILCEFARLHPAGRVVEAATAPICRALAAMCGATDSSEKVQQIDNEFYNKKNFFRRFLTGRTLWLKMKLLLKNKLQYL